MVGGSNPHPLRQGTPLRGGGGATITKHSSDRLICRMVSSSARATQYLSTSSCRQSASAKPRSSNSAISRAWQTIACLSSRRVTFQTTSLTTPRAEANTLRGSLSAQAARASAITITVVPGSPPLAQSRHLDLRPNATQKQRGGGGVLGNREGNRQT
jgi:hypothetical protein